jgi:hypothetical protein
MEKKKQVLVSWREDGEPGVEVRIQPLTEPKVFDSIAEAAEFLGMEGPDLLEWIEAGGGFRSN